MSSSSTTLSLSDSHEEVAALNRHIGRSRNTEKTCMIIGVVAALLTTIALIVAPSAHCSELTMHIIHGSSFSFLITLVMCLAINKLLLNKFKQDSGQILYETFLANPDGDWTQMVPRIGKEQWKSWGKQATLLASKENLSEPEQKMVIFFQAHSRWVSACRNGVKESKIG